MQTVARQFRLQTSWALLFKTKHQTGELKFSRSFETISVVFYALSPRESSRVVQASVSVSGTAL